MDQKHANSDRVGGAPATCTAEPQEGDSDTVMLRKSSIRDRTTLKQALAQDVVSHSDAMANGMSEAMFKQIDTDGDGQLSPAEITQWNAKKQIEEDKLKLQQMLAGDVARMSHSDAISQGMSEAMFKEIDRDGDGELTAAEISQWKEQHPKALDPGARSYLAIGDAGTTDSEEPTSHPPSLVTDGSADGDGEEDF